jgi:hypothetical protein
MGRGYKVRRRDASSATSAGIDLSPNIRELIFTVPCSRLRVPSLDKLDVLAEALEDNEEIALCRDGGID